ncbi:mariner Mos1 transposase [Trichonephila clavata]|uniref:Mariner Mos1 transposase n=1 Tax=Trichonephila clavata TaxID=2740835 RepID=A0A8X6L900_TRICU|nr:mariner Mos1 transposase [Trichonephila clavata]
MALSLSHLQLYHEEEYGFSSQILPGDETRCHHFEPESKRQSKQWKRATSPPPKKSKAVHTSSGKVMSFLNHKCPLLVEFLERELTSMPIVIKPTYRILDETSSQNPQACCPMALFFCIIMPFEHPTYSLNLSLCDIYVFGPLKRAILGHRLTIEDEVCHRVQAWI